MRFWMNPTPLQVAVKQLEEARVNQLVHKAQSEYSAAMAKMLDARIKRLELDLAELTKAPPEQPTLSELFMSRARSAARREGDEHAQL